MVDDSGWEHFDRISERQEAYDRLSEHLGKTTRSIPQWNDAPDTTYEEVIAILKELDV
jgi:hypothetical protein